MGKPGEVVDSLEIFPDRSVIALVLLMTIHIPWELMECNNHRSRWEGLQPVVNDVYCLGIVHRLSPNGTPSDMNKLSKTVKMCSHLRIDK